MMTMASSRETLLKPLPIKTERVDLPEFGAAEYVMCHGMTAREKNKHDSALMKRDWSGVDRKKATTQKERLLVRCIRDDDGQRVFSDEDIDAIGDWPSDTLNRLFDVCNRLSGGGTDSDNDESVKNSHETTDD